MNESKAGKRKYSSKRRADAAEARRSRILECAKELIGSQGIDQVSIAEIAAASAVAQSTVYAAFKSKEGILQALMEQSIFGGRFRTAQRLLEGVVDPVQLVLLTSKVARAIYESERKELGMLRQISGFSPLLRQVEQKFEDLRFEMQKERIELLFAAGKSRLGLSLDEARRIMWMYTSRDVYRMLVIEGGWTKRRYEDWLADMLLYSLVEPQPQSVTQTRD
jgi:AcrR family transcriptional regulator